MRGGGGDSSPDLPRHTAAHIDADGLALSRLLVAKLRFERLLGGSAAAARWFETDPKQFTAAFDSYHNQVSARAFFPSEEALEFQTWLASPSAQAFGTAGRRHFPA